MVGHETWQCPNITSRLVRRNTEVTNRRRLCMIESIGMLIHERQEGRVENLKSDMVDVKLQTVARKVTLKLYRNLKPSEYIEASDIEII